jgi:hypothetical protein
MKLRIIPSILIFISAYSPLSVILALQDWDYPKLALKHPKIVAFLIFASILSCLAIWFSVRFLKSSSPPVTILKVSNQSGELINYSIPYMISFFIMDFDNIPVMCSFFFFMSIMWWMTVKTHNIFINPILACMGYNLYTVNYKISDIETEHEATFLVCGSRLWRGERCRISELSEQLFLITERIQENTTHEKQT